MTLRQKQILIALTLMVAVTRWWAVSASLWDWDEAQFAWGVRSFDVVAHHPHPPGFPLYILAGKVVNLLVGNEFRSLQVINLAAAICLFPALVLMALEMGFSFAVSLGGALICVFAPNVWFFGGTAFSDIPSLTLVVVACVLLLCSRRGWSLAFLAGALVLGIAAGVRPQNLLVGLVPFVLALIPKIRGKQWRLIAAGSLMIAAITAGSYVGAGLASSSWSNYRWTLREHRQYISRKDTVGSPTRPPLLEVTDDFFVREFQFFRAGIVIVSLSILSVIHTIIRRRRPPLILLLTFGPFAAVAWLMLDHHSANRFSIGYLPLFAILAADGAKVLGQPFRLSERVRELAASAVAIIITLGLIAWALPGIAEARSTVTPTLAAAQWIRANLSPEDVTVYATDATLPIAEYLIPEYRLVRVADERAVPLRPDKAVNAYVLAEGATEEPSGFNFLRSRKSRLWRIARRRYFEVSIIPLARRAQFLDGWHEMENIGAETWRWMGRRSVTILPPQPPPAQLRLTLGVPLDAIPVPAITITLNGQQIDRFRGASPQNPRVYVTANSRGDSPNELVIETDQWVNPKQRGISRDGRDLGLRLQDMTWGPAPPAASSRR